MNRSTSNADPLSKREHGLEKRDLTQLVSEQMLVLNLYLRESERTRWANSRKQSEAYDLSA